MYKTVHDSNSKNTDGETVRWWGMNGAALHNEEKTLSLEEVKQTVVKTHAGAFLTKPLQLQRISTTETKNQSL